MAKKVKIPERIGTQGWEQFLATKQEMLYQFDLAKVYAQSHIVKVSHGRVAEATFRKWLANFLPKRYGVTSGYIVSQSMQFANLKLPHYDVIIYDQLDSPTLWVEENSDYSENGKTRAIPAEYVRAVIEVKSNLTEETSKKAIDKLLELETLIFDVKDESNYSGKLHKQFIAAAVFFELLENNQYKTAILDNLVVKPSFPFYGGIVLRAEGRSLNDTGKFNILKGETQINTTVANNKASLCHGEPFSNTKMFDDNVHIGVMLTWKPPNFSFFAFDLIAILEGKFRPGYASSNYGLSWHNPVSKK